MGLSGHLTSVEKNGTPQESYAYDANSNRTTTTYAGDAGSTAINATFDARDRMTTYGNLALSYNDDGELTEKQNTTTGDTTTYTYSTLGQLRTATLPSGQTLAYTYDASGNLVAKKSAGQTERAFLYAPGSLSPITELNAAGNPVANFIYATRSTAPDYMVKNGQKYRIITDQIGSVKLVVHVESGSVEQAIDYDAFGRVLSDSNPGFQPFGFAGGIYDRDTKLTHFGAREYDAELGRWTSSDPIGFAGGDSNLYGYVVQDPVNLIDPSGLYVSWDRVTGGGIVQDVSNGVNGGIERVGGAINSALYPVADSSAGFASAYDQGLSKWSREQLGTDDNVDYCSGWYASGRGIGSVTWLVTMMLAPGGAAAHLGKLPVRVFKWIKKLPAKLNPFPKQPNPLPPKTKHTPPMTKFP